MRFFGLIAVLVVAASIAAASAHTQNRDVHYGEPVNVELTYTKWFAPGFPNMVGVVGGDLVGRFGGAVLERTPDATGHFVHLTAIYIVIAADPEQSFTARVEGIQDNQTATANLDGRVIDGALDRAHVHAQYKVVTCTEAPSGKCFQGTISVTRSLGASAD
jgi:hypothetical protein